jgi:hypothetical protein
MSQFNADFKIEGNGSYAGDRIFFFNQSLVGQVVPHCEIDGDVDGINKEDYTVNYITKYQWNIDGNYYSEKDISHIFKLSGVQQVQLKVWSEPFYTNDGKVFYFTSTIFKDIEVKSRFLKLIMENDPTFDIKGVPETQDFYSAIAKMFERIYKDTQGIFNLWDIDKIPAEFFEYISLTLGHTSSYSQKVGYSEELDIRFSDYNIYDRIALGAATAEEIRYFRRFLLFSSEFFRSKGSPESVKQFLSFFSIDGKAIELWTRNWGQVPYGVIHDNFIGFDISKNKLGLSYYNIRAIGNNNENSVFSKTLNGFIVNNFNQNQVLEVDADVVGESSEGWYEFELDYSYPYISNIFKQDGTHLVLPEMYNLEHKYYDIIPNDPVRYDSSKPAILQISPEVVDIGEKIYIQYKVYKQDEDGKPIFVDSMLGTRNSVVKDFDINVKWKFLETIDSNIKESMRYSEDEIFIGLRGIVSNTGDIYSHFNEYYKVSVNGRRSTVSLSKITKGFDDTQVVNQKINLNSDTNNPVYDLVINNSEECGDVFKINKNLIYELKVQINGNLISAYIRENDIDGINQDNVDFDRGGSDFTRESNLEWIVLFKNIDLVSSKNLVLSLDEDSNIVSSVEYVPIVNGGNIGIGCKNSIVEFREVTLDNLDPDISLYDTSSKELNLQPKYVDWLGSRLLQYNNSNVNKKSFANIIEDKYDPSVVNYPLKENETTSLEFLYFDNINVNEEVATRFTITFDEHWMKENFSSQTELKNKIIVPFGDQRMWWMPELRQHNKNDYKNFYGDDSTSEIITSETDNITSQKFVNIPGLHNYNESVVLDTYDTKPNDYFSELKRTPSDTSSFSNKFTISERLIDYLECKKTIAYRGVFQEISPYSAYFPKVNGDFFLENGQKFVNKIFNPIILNSQNNKKVIGIRFKNCDDIQRIIDNFSTDLSIDVQIYGEFEFELSDESLKFRPDKTSLNPTTRSGYSKVKIFIPLGVLDVHRRTYSLNTEFLNEMQNSGSGYIRITGVYIRIPRELTVFRESQFEIEIHSSTLNPYESVELELQCKHFISAQINLGGGIETFGGSDFYTNTYMIDSTTRNLLLNISNKVKGGKSFNEFEWWMPKGVWRKRDVVKRPPNYFEDILSNINYSSISDFDKYFYNLKLDKGSEKPKALTFSIVDGNITPKTVYYAKVNVNFEYSGFDWDNIKDASSPSNAIDGEELSRLVVEGVRGSNYTDFKMSPTVTCLTFYIPISWYAENTDNKLEWFNYITGSTGDNSMSPSISITPIGLMTYLINNSGDSTSNSINRDALEITKGWGISDWNRLFDSGVNVEFIAEKISEEYVSIFNKFSFNRGYPLNEGAYIDIKYNISDRDSIKWDVLDDFKIYSRESNQVDFDVPKEVNDIKSWILDVKSITLSNFIISERYYKIPNKTLLTFTNTFNMFKGASLNGRWFFDIFFNTDNVETISDDYFNPNFKRNIRWLPYESDDTDIYSTTKRKYSTDLVFSSSDRTYDLIKVNNTYCFKSLMENTSLSTDYKKIGMGDRNNNIVKVTREESSNIRKLYMIDANNSVFDFETEIYFDPEMSKKKNYKGKKFEHIIKADNIYDSIQGKNIVGGYYFIGVGVYDFDIAIGVARYDRNTGKMNKSFLAGFGDFDTKGIELGVWYKLRTIVDTESIKVIFNGVKDPDRLVINYNINKLIHDDSNRYNKGHFEDPSYLITGLDKMDITYPEALSSYISERFSEENYDENLVREYRPSGSRTGMLFYNDMTYVSKAIYKSLISNDKIFGDSYDKTDITSILNQIRYNFKVNDGVRYIGKTTNGNLAILCGDILFNKNVNSNVSIYDSDVENVVIENDKVVIKYNENRGHDIRITNEDFKTYNSLFVKDNTFYEDHIYKYNSFTNRNVKNVWVSSGILHVEFEDNL